MSVFDAGDVTTEQAGTLFEIDSGSRQGIEANRYQGVGRDAIASCRLSGASLQEATSPVFPGVTSMTATLPDAT